MQEFVASARLQEKFFVGGEAGGVGQKLAQRYVVAARISFFVGNEFRNDSGHRGVKIEQAAFVEDHCHRRCGDYFGEGGEIEECRGVDLRIPTLRQAQGRLLRKGREEWG